METKIFIVNGRCNSGKTTFEKIVSKYVNTVFYSIVDLPKNIIEDCLGENPNSKEEKMRKLISDIKLALEDYDDIPYKDVSLFINDIKNYNKEIKIIFIDMREIHNIEKAKKDFNAKLIFIDNQRCKKVVSNVADKNMIEDNYDYKIDNNGTLEQFEYNIKLFIKDVIMNCEVDKNKCLKCPLGYDDDEEIYCELD